MYCRTCGYLLIGLQSARCPECGRDFDPADTRTFDGRPRSRGIRRVLRGLFRAGTVIAGAACLCALVILWLELQWQREQRAIVLLNAAGAAVASEEVGPPWLQNVLGGRLSYLGEHAMTVDFSVLPRAAERVTDKDLAPVRDLPQLRTLLLTDTKVTDAGIDHLAGLSRLETLVLIRTRITDTGLLKLARSRSLQALYVDWTSVTHSGIVHLRRTSRLEDVSLSGTATTDATLETLAGLPRLRRLGLYATNITDDGLGHLGRCHQLTDLNLKETAVTDAGVLKLKRLPLRELSVQNTRVTRSGIDELRKSIPHLAVSGS